MNRFLDYLKDSFAGDLKAGFITSIVALPLAIALSVASGVSPVMGIYTAIIAGILGSLFGGSIFSITGPTGAMTVIILSTMHSHGLEGLFLAGFLAGVIQILLGAFRLGKLIKFIPFPIISGFTAGIGIMIIIGQIPNFLGLNIPAKEYAFETLFAVYEGLGSINIIVILLSLFTLLMLLFLPSYLSRIPVIRDIPASLMALVASTIAVVALSLDVPIIGEIPITFPTFSMININLALVRAVLPAAFTIALLGSIEALLCAVVADGMSGKKHNSNKELVGQGICNVVLPFVSAIPATAAIARTAVNIREGAKTRLSGVYHALFMLLIVAFLMPLAMHIPKAFLAGILFFIGFRMVNFKEFRTIMRISRIETIVFLVTLILTVFTNLVFAIQVGMMLSIFVLFVKMSNMLEFRSMESYDGGSRYNQILEEKGLKDKIGIYTINGPFFFGAMNVFESKVNEYVDTIKQHMIIRMKNVPIIDSSAVIRLTEFIEDRTKKGHKVYLASVSPNVLKVLRKNKHFSKVMPEENIFESTQDAILSIEIFEMDINGK